MIPHAFFSNRFKAAALGFLALAALPSPAQIDAVPSSGAGTVAKTSAPDPLKARIEVSLRTIPLRRVLDTLAVLASCSFSYSSTYLDVSRPVEADFHGTTLEEALRRLLGPSLAGLRAQGSAVVLDIRPVPEAAPPKEDTVVGDLSSVVVKATRRGYAADKPSASLRLQSSLLETPQIITPITSDLIRDQQLTVLSDAARNVSGVATVYPDMGVNTDFNIRGTRSYAGRLRNGLPITGYSSLQEDMSYVESVEFIKGPAGFMLSQGEPGGMYNVITKKPLAKAHRSATIQTGSYGLLRTSVDVGGPAGNGLFYRVNMMGQKSGTHHDYGRDDRFSLAPVFRYELSDATSATVEYNLDLAAMKATLPLVPTVDGKPLRRNFMIDDPSIEPSTYEHHHGLVNLQHRLSADWLLTAQAGASYYIPSTSQLFDGGPVDSAGMLDRNLRYYDEENRAATAQIFLNGNAKTGPVGHRILAGFDGGLHEYRYRGAYAWPVLPINVHDPVYGVAHEADSLLDKENMHWDPTEFTSWQAVSILDDIQLLSWLQLSLGGRFTYHQYGYAARLQTDKVFTPRAGLVVRLGSSASLYGLYDRAFIPQAGATFDGERFEPLTGDNVEAGVKWLGFDGRLLAQAAVFRIVKNNVLTNDPDNIDFSIQRGQIRSRGVELDVEGKVTEGLSLVTNYALTDARITKDTDPNAVGQREPAPMTIVNGWAKYTVQGGLLQGLGLGLGAIWHKDRFMFTEKRDPSEPSRKLPDMHTFDAAVSYRLGKLDLALNVENLTDEFNYIGYYEYWVGDDGEYRIMTLPGTNFRVAATYNF